MKKHALIFAATLILISCGLDQQQSMENEQCDLKNKYCISFGSSMNDRPWTNNWSDSRGKNTDHTLSNGLDSYNDNYIRADLYSSSCPPPGIIEPKEMPFEGGKGTWAKMPINRAYEDKLFCMPPYTDKCTEEAYWSSGCNDGTAAYAFCAEKDGKAVAICIQQMTDDEAMAKEIFESFRWTD